jgi:hypothetical protein
MTPSVTPFIQWFADITIDDIPHVGGKNASLGEMVRELASKGVKVPDGFAITAETRYFGPGRISGLNSAFCPFGAQMSFLPANHGEL